MGQDTNACITTITHQVALIVTHSTDLSHHHWSP